MRRLMLMKIIFLNPKAFFFDMDATVICEESLNFLAEHCGVTKEVTDITKRAMNGELDFSAALSARLELLKGLDISDVHSSADKISYAPGIIDFIAKCHQKDILVFLVSGGFEPFAKKVAQDLNFKRYLCNNFQLENGKLVGTFIPPLVDAAAKAQFLIDTCAEFNISPASVVAVGDGANDIPMAQAAGFSVGFQPKDALRKIVSFVNDSGDHKTMLSLFF